MSFVRVARASFRISCTSLGPIPIVVPRRYVSFAGKDNHHIHNLHPWPIHKYPTPYDIFDLKRDFDEKELKRRYRDFVKLYHPDLSRHHQILNQQGTEVDGDSKDDRFKKILAAYEILNDKHKKTLYDQFQTGWNDATHIRREDFDKTPAGNYGYYHEQSYWAAATWEDYEEIRRRASDPDLQEQSKRNIAIGVGLLLVIGMSLQFLVAYQWSERDLLILGAVSKKSSNDLKQVYSNYGYGDDKLSRIDRFLTFRRLLLIDDDEKIKQAEAKDDKLLQKYGKGK